MSRRAKLPHEKAADAARRRAKRHVANLIPASDQADDYADAIDRYVDAVERGAQFRAQWKDLGRPGMTEGSQGQDVPHPLVIMMRDEDKIADTFAGRLGLHPAKPDRSRPNAGRPTGSNSAPDRRPGEPAKLRRVQ